MAAVTKMPLRSSTTPHLRSRLFLSGKKTGGKKSKSSLKKIRVFTNVLFIRNKASQLVKEIRRGCEDTMDSQPDAAEGEGFSTDIEHIILPQV